MCKGLTCTTKNTDFSSGKVNQTGTVSHFSPCGFWKFDEEPTDNFPSSVTNLIANEPSERLCLDGEAAAE